MGVAIFGNSAFQGKIAVVPGESHGQKLLRDRRTISCNNLETVKKALVCQAQYSEL
jgi:hypothetical protein